MVRETTHKSIEALCISILKDELTSKQHIENSLVTCIINLIQSERDQEMDHRNYLKELVRMTIDLDLYKNNLEPAFLETTRAFYQEKSNEIVGRVVLAEYLRYAEDKIKEECARMQYYMHPSTAKPGLEVLQTVIVLDNAGELIGNGFRDLCDQERCTDLARMYRLYVNIGQ